MLTAWQLAIVNELRKGTEAYRACDLAGVNRSRAYYCYNRNLEFAEAWDNALLAHLEEKIRLRRSRISSLRTASL